MRPLLVAAVLALIGIASGEDAASDVPDPFGLGERLALIDWLHAHQVEVAEGAELADLRQSYRAARSAEADPLATTAATAPPDPDRESAALELWRRHSENPAANATADDIRKRIAELDAERAATDEAELERQRAEAARPGTQHVARPAPPAQAPHPAATAAAQPVPPKNELAEIREITRPRGMGEQVRAFLVSPGKSPILIVVCDADLLGLMERVLMRWPAEERLAAGVDGTVIIHGHSDGGYFNHGVLADRGAIGGDLAAHLRANREYYETMGGTRERKPIDLAVMTGCNAGGFNEENELKDGLGYRPLHRVFTAPECYDAAFVCLPAIFAAGASAYDRVHPLRARYRWSEQATGLDGKKRQVACYAVVDDAALDIHDQLRKFVVGREGIAEEP